MNDLIRNLLPELYAIGDFQLDVRVDAGGPFAFEAVVNATGSDALREVAQLADDRNLTVHPVPGGFRLSPK